MATTRFVLAPLGPVIGNLTACPLSESPSEIRAELIGRIDGQRSVDRLGAQDAGDGSAARFVELALATC